MRKPLSRGEKWLLLSPLPVALFLIAALLWKRQSQPEIVKLPLPVCKACFLPGGKLFVVLTTSNPRMAPFPKLAVYDIATGKEVSSQQLRKEITISATTPSPDGKFCIVTTYDRSNWKMGTVLKSLPNFTTLKTINNDYQRFEWLGPQELFVESRRTRDFWHIDQNGHVKSRSAGEREAFNISPDGKWQVERREEKDVKFDDGYGGKSTREMASHYLVSTRLIGESRKLPGETWFGLSWQKGGKELWGVGILDGTYPNRGDILHYDTATHQTSSIPLEIPSETYQFNRDFGKFAFSPDGRLLIAGSPKRSLTIWNAATGKLLKSFSDDSPIFPIPDCQPHFSPDGQKLLRLTQEGVEIYRQDQILSN